MNIEELRQYCIEKADVEEGFPFGETVLVFKVKGKMFLLLPLDTDDLRFNVKCDPEKAIELRAEYPCVQPGFHMSKTHWNTVFVDGSVTDEMVLSWVDDSYALVSKVKGKGAKVRKSK
ncbi:MAG TPA: MmcQ/YjbR family DNA-binding protein [Bacteroidia bacterium]|jgi:predicted DNA-binding protein (MmcQ/YjbR family)|nr:MmcQ/YjbR family DNA-binding protein [Bacteroidota bacterium]MBP9790238.1 MmcQ/YjbR family DNA-binding protein [Bacteroidia bacterium]MBK7431451.1 MmcQ/YjbR family DNA-binding protein [Bacteroidota bacterium]MBK8587398.1 MmcQ/YjbR family DNA-binding protein [Bacteroidota bacterium]HQW00291.1 MmcQ/YjbR family DNA-binding protein [Bacteroidia bacterium]